MIRFGKLGLGVAIAAFLAGCTLFDNPDTASISGTSPGVGNISLSIAIPGDRSVAGVLDVVDHLDLKVTSAGLSSPMTSTIAHSGLTSGSGSAQFTKVPAGAVTLTASAVDANSNEVGNGSVDVTVVAGKTVTANLSLSVHTQGGIQSTISLVDADASAPPAPSFAQIQTILQNRCLSCHSGPSPSAGRDWSVAQTVHDNAALIKTRVVTQQSMPQGNSTNMTTEERTLVGQWVDAGASIN